MEPDVSPAHSGAIGQDIEASIAINGVCLTVAELAPGEIGFDVIKETLDKTNLGLLSNGDHVNVERAMRAGDRIDGHFVQGHVDGVALVARQQ